MSTDIIAKQDARELAELLIGGQISFAEATSNSDAIDSGQLYTGDDLDHFKGIQFAVIGGTFREGYEREIGGKKVSGDYVSLECIVGDEKALKGVDLDSKPFGPLDVIRINDGSTGIRRQIVKYLHMRGLIAVVADGVELRETGSLGESTYDIPVGMWANVYHGDLQVDEKGNATYEFTIPGLFLVKRGVRSSTYKAEKTGKMVTTRFLA